MEPTTWEIGGLGTWKPGSLGGWGAWEPGILGIWGPRAWDLGWGTAWEDLRMSKPSAAKLRGQISPRALARVITNKPDYQVTWLLG